jgi:hypothetical protein
MDLLLTLVRDYASVFTAGLEASTHPHGQNEATVREPVLGDGGHDAEGCSTR